MAKNKRERQEGAIKRLEKTIALHEANSTLTKQMFSALRDYIDPTIAAISTLMILLSTGLMLGLQMLGNKLTRQKLP